MRIAYVSGNREKLPDAAIPLGILYVMASTPSRHQKLLIDLCFEPNAREVLAQRLAEFVPDLIALGMRNIQNNDYSGISDNLEYYSELIAATRESSNAPIVLGGSGFSVMPEALMAQLRPDFGISGEGERAFPALIECLESGTPSLDEIGGLLRLDEGTVVSTPRDPQFLDMNQIREPDRRLLDPRYYERYGIDSIQTKRGCPLLCDYCTYPQIEGRIGRAREPAGVVDEMFRAVDRQPGIRHFFIVDSVFNLPKTHAKNVCRELISRKWEIPWTCYANPLGFDEEFAGLAKQAGCAGMEIGSDSGCDEVLVRLRKGFTVDQIVRIHDLCKSVDIPDCHTFILGTEGESIEDVRHTLDFVVDLDPFSAIMMTWVDDHEALEPDLRRRRDELRHQISDLLLEKKDQHPHWIIPALGINFDSRLFRRLRRDGLHGPLWQHIRAPSA